MYICTYICSCGTVIWSCHLNFKWLTCSCVRVAITTYMSRSSCSREETGMHTLSIRCLPWPEITTMTGFINAQRKPQEAQVQRFTQSCNSVTIVVGSHFPGQGQGLHIYSTTHAHILGNSGFTLEKLLQVAYPSSFDHNFTWWWSPIYCQLQTTYCHCVLQ